MPNKVIVVVLRQPYDSDDRRSDPFYEFGSFGITGCHHHLVMAETTDGARLAFAQGGRGGFRLLFLSPPVRFVRQANRSSELRWNSKELPLRFDDAPFLVHNGDLKPATAITRLVADANRGSWAARFSSKFRSRNRPVPEDVAEEIVAMWDAVSGMPRARFYDEALPARPASPDRDRLRTYLAKGGNVEAAKTTSRCTPRRSPSRVPRKAARC